MTDTRDWATERAERYFRTESHTPSTFAAALRKAEERGRASAIDLARLQSLSDPNDPSFHEGRLAERQAIEAQLIEPDEAMVEAVAVQMAGCGLEKFRNELPEHVRTSYFDDAENALDAVCHVLFPPSKEGE
jgi:hypothetical protein